MQIISNKTWIEPWNGVVVDEDNATGAELHFRIELLNWTPMLVYEREKHAVSLAKGSRKRLSRIVCFSVKKFIWKKIDFGLFIKYMEGGGWRVEKPLAVFQVQAWAGFWIRTFFGWKLRLYASSSILLGSLYLLWSMGVARVLEGEEGSG